MLFRSLVFPLTKLLIIAYNDGRVSVRLPGVFQPDCVTKTLHFGRLSDPARFSGEVTAEGTAARWREKDIPLPYLGWNPYLSGGGELEWRRKT